MRFRRSFLFLCLIHGGFISISQAKNEAILFGGGGEPRVSQGTIFDQSLKNFGLLKPGSGWTTRTYFNGGHPESDAIADSVTKGKNQPMTTENVQAEIQRLKIRIGNGELKKGDQLLLTFATHGFRKNTGSDSHKVATTDGEFDLDELKTLISIAEQKGVKVAIMDYSCHSGATLSLGSDKTCVITGASDNVAYNNTGNTFSKNLQKGHNLENIFLSFRASKNSGTPQISTDAGIKTYSDTKALSSWMLYDESLDQRLSSRKSCDYLSSERLDRLSRDLKAIERSQKTLPLYAPLEKSVNSYNKIRHSAENLFDQKKKLENKICIRDVCGTRLEWDREYQVYKKERSKFSASEEEIFKEVEAKLNSSEHRAWKLKEQEYLLEATSLRSQAEAVAQAERDIYFNLYQNYSAKSKRPNPCRGFVL